MHIQLPKKGANVEKLTKHTLGPWWHDDGAYIGRGSGHHYRPIALAIDVDNDAERAANARLIASAPEMLATLKEVMEKIENVIEKAEGKS